MRKLFPFVFSVFVLAGCSSAPVVENEEPVENPEEQVVEEVQEETQKEVKKHEEGYFSIEYPADFELIEVDDETGNYDNNHDDYAEFKSPDGTVSFAVYSPLWHGKGVSIMPNEETESETEREVKTSVMAQSEIGPNANRIDTYITVVADDQSYWRSIVDTVYEKDSSKTQRTFSYKYKDQESYDKYLEDYKKFKASLEQYADGRIDKPLDDLPAEISEKGYTRLAKSQTNESGTYKYDIYTDGKECNFGYLGDNVPVYCLLIVTDLSDGSVVLDAESNNKAQFTLNGEQVSPPTGWYNDESLLIESGFGDGGVGWSSAGSYNINTGEFTQIYKESASIDIGSLLTIGDNQLLFYSPHTEGNAKIDVYEILDPIEDIWDLYVDDNQTEIDLSKGKKINEIDAGWVYYRIGKGVVVYEQDDYHDAHESYIYDIDSNEFIPYSE